MRPRLQLFQLLTQGHPPFAGGGNAVGKGCDAGFQLLVQGFQLVNIVAFAPALTELIELAFGILLFTQTLFKLRQTTAQPVRLFGLMTLINAFAQQLARHAPGFITRQRAVDLHHQLVSLFKLAVRGLRHAHLLFQRQHFLRRFLLFRLESFQPLVGALRR